MAYLLDTNAISEINKPQPNPGFMAWFQESSISAFYASCMTFGEIYKGIELLPDIPKRTLLEQRAADILEAFAGRILTVDLDTALLWAKLVAQGAKTGRTPPAVDTLLAAQCIQHRLTLITRNLRDFEHFAGLSVHCPWTDVEGL